MFCVHFVKFVFRLLSSCSFVFVHLLCFSLFLRFRSVYFCLISVPQLLSGLKFYFCLYESPVREVHVEPGVI